MGTIIASVYFGVAAALAAVIVWSGVTGRWSKDDWPVFALLVPWFWPLLLPLGVWFGFLDNIAWPLIERDRPVIWNPLKWQD